MSEPDTYEKPKHGWTCFHCGETFAKTGSARDHFGAQPSASPACRIKLGAERGLVMELRKAEAEVARLETMLHEEATDIHMRMAQQAIRHHQQLEDVEALGYERGLRAGRALARSEARAAVEA